MKTIERAASIYAEPIASDLSHKSMDDLNNCDLEDYIAESFKEGVEFAQRFIPYSEKEKPNAGERVIIRRNTCLGDHFICAEIFYTESKTPLWKSNGDFYLVEDTHWRPIELK